ncbi:GNAT family N-acetyltransferase [Aureimonas ureilytica]|uniref:GNAT family N-acetyltransferase n=1 Tax=Aureimonas ureilytica TaxID=401562 RepID=UPI003CEF06B5
MSLSSFSDRSALPGGSVHIRRLRRSDRTDFLAHLLRLDPETRRLRFGSVVNDAFLRRYADTALRPDSVVKGLFAGGTLRGVAELCALATNQPEAAFSLERDWQGQGLGTRLFASLVDAARNVGAKRFVIHCMRDNVAIQKIARRYEAELRFDDGDVIAELRRPGGDTASRAREAAEERFARARSAADRALYRLAAEVGIDLRLRRAND